MKKNILLSLVAGAIISLLGIENLWALENINEVDKRFEGENGVNEIESEPGSGGSVTYCGYRSIADFQLLIGDQFEYNVNGTTASAYVLLEDADSVMGPTGKCTLYYENGHFVIKGIAGFKVKSQDGSVNDVYPPSSYQNPTPLSGEGCLPYAFSLQVVDCRQFPNG